MAALLSRWERTWDMEADPSGFFKSIQSKMLTRRRPSSASSILRVCCPLIGGTCPCTKEYIHACQPFIRSPNRNLHVFQCNMFAWQIGVQSLMNNRKQSRCLCLGWARRTWSCRRDRRLQMGSGMKSARVPMNCPTWHSSKNPFRYEKPLTVE